MSAASCASGDFSPYLRGLFKAAETLAGQARGAAAGMTGAHMRAENRGFATFETRMELFPPTPSIGESVAISSGLLDLGKSSVKILHEMKLARGLRRVARFYQAGVYFDLDARRSAPLPDALRTTARKLLI